MIFAPRNGCTLRVCRARKSNLLARGAYEHGAAQLTYRGHSSPVSHALFTADQSSVISISSLDHSVMVWRYRKYGNKSLVASPTRKNRFSLFGPNSPTASILTTPRSDITSTDHLQLEQIIAIDLAPTPPPHLHPLGVETAIIPYTSNTTKQTMVNQNDGEGVEGGELGEELRARAFPDEAEFAESRLKDTRGVLRWNFARSLLPAVVSSKGDLLVFGHKEVTRVVIMGIMTGI